MELLIDKKWLAQQFKKVFVEIADLKSEMGGMKTEITDMKSEMSGMKTEIVDMKSEMSGMRGDIKEIKDRGDLNYKRLNYLVDRIGRIKADTDILKKDVKHLKKDNRELRSDVRELDVKLASLNKKYTLRTDQLGDDVEDHERRLVSVEMAVRV